jgi:hypothetical protein
MLLLVLLLLLLVLVALLLAWSATRMSVDHLWALCAAAPAIKGPSGRHTTGARAAARGSCKRPCSPTSSWLLWLLLLLVCVGLSLMIRCDSTWCAGLLSGLCTGDMPGRASVLALCWCSCPMGCRLLRVNAS